MKVCLGTQYNMLKIYKNQMYFSKNVKLNILLQKYAIHSNRYNFYKEVIMQNLSGSYILYRNKIFGY